MIQGKQEKLTKAHLEVALGVEQEVFGLEVAVDNVQSVQMLEGGDNLLREEAGRFVAKLARSAQVGEELAADRVL
jgi:hypothetical protein